jgi:hypothetical protein
MSVTSPDIATLMNALSLNSKSDKSSESDRNMILMIQSNPSLMKPFSAALINMVISSLSY